MFAIAFDLVVADARRHYPKGVGRAYGDIGKVLSKHGFRRAQGSVYLTDNDDLGNVFAAMVAMKTMGWFGKCVREVRGFRVENWSNFTPHVVDSSTAACTKGFEEPAASYDAGVSQDPDQVAVGQYRRFGDDGPAYEVVEITSRGDAVIEVVYSGERLTYPVADVRCDPMAETIP